MHQVALASARSPQLKVGDIVEVRSAAEILGTLDGNGMLDSLPFMPEMLQYCGRRFVVSKRAFKVCGPMGTTGLRRMTDAVHLGEVRCDGSGHDGCQAACLIYWKTAWLKRSEGAGASEDAGTPARERHASPPADPSATLRVVTSESSSNGGATVANRKVFICQATELVRAAPVAIPPTDWRQYVEDVNSGNAGIAAVARSLLVGFFNSYQRWSAQALPDRLLIKGGTTYPFIEGKLHRSPTATLGLQPGDRVRIKSKQEILATLDAENKNRGLSFDGEMLKYCGRSATVLRRVERIIDENTGEMVTMKNPCIMLEGVVCTSDFHRNCPRGIYSYWREVWLERLVGRKADPPTSDIAMGRQ